MITVSSFSCNGVEFAFEFAHFNVVEQVVPSLDAGYRVKCSMGRWLRSLSEGLPDSLLHDIFDISNCNVDEMIGLHLRLALAFNEPNRFYKAFLRTGCLVTRNGSQDDEIRPHREIKGELMDRFRALIRRPGPPTRSA